MNRFTLSLSIALAASPAFAHEGPRVWIGNDAGTVRTYTSDNDLEPAVYTPARIFSATLPKFFGVYTTEFPGYEVRQDGGSVPTDTLFGFKMAGPLLMLEPAMNRLRPTSQIFTSTPAPQLGVTLGNTTIITSTGVQDGFDFFNFGGIGDHAHMSFTLLGENNSPTASTPDGVYVMPMLLTSSRLTRSDWYFLVLNKNGTATQINQAKTLSHQMEIAEPGDTNFDGLVNFDDLLTLAQNYGATSGKWWATGDFDFNGDVSFDDLLSLAQHYGSGSLVSDSFQTDWALARSLSPSLTPEPTTLSIVCGCVMVTRRRRVDHR